MSSTFRSSLVQWSNGSKTERPMSRASSFTPIGSSELCLGRLKDTKRSSFNKLDNGNILASITTGGKVLQASKSSFCLASLASHDKVLSEGLQLFKENPQMAIDYLIQEGRIDNTPESIGKILSEEDFDKDGLGTYLSEESSSEILRQYVNNLDFEDMDFDLALRKFLTCFKLPGEAQKIDRFMKNFAARYYETHKSDFVFRNELSVYAMAFGTIMLNTDAHNNHVQNKMTEKQFIENIHYTQGGEKIPEEFLSDLYERIITREIKFSRDEMDFPDAIKMGHVFLHSKGTKWHSRWLILSNKHLFFLKKPQDQVPLLGVSLLNCAVGPIGQEKGKQYCIRVHLPNEDSKKLPYIILGFKSGHELSKWSMIIQNSITIDETLLCN